jgi:outer membrane protein assembly factor BamB
MIPMHRVVVSLVSVVLGLTVAPAADWSRFRGPNGSGIAEGVLPPIDPKAPLWKVEIPGQGRSSPVVVAGKVFLQTASSDGQSRSLLCLDATSGKTLWTRDVPAQPIVKKKNQGVHAKNSLASSTPACDGQHVYCVWWDGSGVALHAYDLMGNEVWRTSLGGFVSQHGPGFSPVLHGGRVYVNVDDDERAELVALDAKTGEKKWTAQRKKERACYSTPFVLKRGDRPEELIVGTTHQITSYEPATGRVNWNFTVSWANQKAPLRVIGAPVYAGGLIVMSCGDGNGSRYMIAVNPDGPTPVRAWEADRDSLPYVPCMLAQGDLLFWIGDKVGGVACCAEAKTGKILFSERITTKEPSASPVLVGNEILSVAENGEVVVFKAAREFEQVAKANLGEPVFATPAVANGRVYIRGGTHLFCFGDK